MNPILLDTLLGLQVFQVLFLALHDWIPLGRLNDVKAARAAREQIVRHHACQRTAFCIRPRRDDLPLERVFARLAHHLAVGELRHSISGPASRLVDSLSLDPRTHAGRAL